MNMLKIGLFVVVAALGYTLRAQEVSANEPPQAGPSTLEDNEQYKHDLEDAERKGSAHNDTKVMADNSADKAHEANDDMNREPAKNRKKKKSKKSKKSKTKT